MCVWRKYMTCPHKKEPFRLPKVRLSLSFLIKRRQRSTIVIASTRASTSLRGSSSSNLQCRSACTTFSYSAISTAVGCGGCAACAASFVVAPGAETTTKPSKETRLHPLSLSAVKRKLFKCKRHCKPFRGSSPERMPTRACST